MGQDHPIAAGQVLLAVGECTEIPQYLNLFFLQGKQRGEELASSNCAVVKVQRQTCTEKFSQHMFGSYEDVYLPRAWAENLAYNTAYRQLCSGVIARHTQDSSLRSAVRRGPLG